MIARSEDGKNAVSWAALLPLQLDRLSPISARGAAGNIQMTFVR
jgi:hypothetical protein